MMNYLVFGLAVLATDKFVLGGILAGAQGNDLYNEDEWEPVYRIYSGDDWNSHDDYLSQERAKRDGDEDDSQFRSWKLDQWNNYKVQKVKVEIYDDNDEVVEFEFVGSLQNATSFFNPRALVRSSFDDIPDAFSTGMFRGDDFSFDGDDDSRHWAVSSRHVGDCLNDEGWFQVLDKPKPGRDRCVCGYENVAKYPAIMYSKNRRKTKWSDRRNVGYADMMQVSVSHKPYQTGTPPPVAPAPAPAPPQLVQNAPVQGFRTLVRPGVPPQGMWFET